MLNNNHTQNQHESTINGWDMVGIPASVRDSWELREICSLWNLCETGWWLTYPSEKSWSSSVGMMNFPIYGRKVIKNVPNHQSGNCWVSFTNLTSSTNRAFGGTFLPVSMQTNAANLSNIKNLFENHQTACWSIGFPMIDCDYTNMQRLVSAPFKHRSTNDALAIINDGYSNHLLQSPHQYDHQPSVFGCNCSDHLKHLETNSWRTCTKSKTWTVLSCWNDFNDLTHHSSWRRDVRSELSRYINQIIHWLI